MCIYKDYENGHERCGETITRGVIDQVIIFVFCGIEKQLRNFSLIVIYFLSIFRVINYIFPNRPIKMS